MTSIYSSLFNATGCWFVKLEPSYNFWLICSLPPKIAPCILAGLQYFEVVFTVYVSVFWLVSPSQDDRTAKKWSLQKLPCLIARIEKFSSLSEHLLLPPCKMLSTVSLGARQKSSNCYFHFLHALPLETKSISPLKISSVLPCPLAEK